jgi:hypothetical protein
MIKTNKVDIVNPDLFAEQSEDIDLPDYRDVDKILENVNIAGLAGLGGIDAMKSSMLDNLKIYEMIIAFVNENFIEGIDYGKGDPRSEKKTLLKPGAEKICRLFDTHPEWFNDKETWEMLGRPTGTIFFICRIVKNNNGKIIGEGRGACTIGVKFNGQAEKDANGAVKFGKKRSLVDAALSTFMLSERFTQDLEEIKSFIDVKAQFFVGVQKMRAGIKSDLTDNAFIRKVCENEIHKKMITTKTELDLVTNAITLYDFATGEKA